MTSSEPFIGLRVSKFNVIPKTLITKITTKEVKAPLQEEKDWGSSLFFPPTRATTSGEKKKILSSCVEQGLLAALDSHLYLWHREVKKQEDGLPIGLDLTRAVARLVLMD